MGGQGSFGEKETLIGQRQGGWAALRWIWEHDDGTDDNGTKKTQIRKEHGLENGFDPKHMQ